VGIVPHCAEPVAHFDVFTSEQRYPLDGETLPLLGTRSGGRRMFGLSSQLGSAVIVVLHVRSDRRVAQQGCGAQR
jgi:hypothetical protein